jgi:hypothetical protein
MVGELGDNRDRYQDPTIAQCEAGSDDRDYAQRRNNT